MYRHIYNLYIEIKIFIKYVTYLYKKMTISLARIFYLNFDILLCRSTFKNQRQVKNLYLLADYPQKTFDIPLRAARKN